jgi:hypothetical protein
MVGSVKLWKRLTVEEGRARVVVTVVVKSQICPELSSA